MLEIRLAEAGDLPVILEIYRRARRFMAENGNPTQWGDGHPPRQLLEADVAARRLYAVTDGGRVCGAFAFVIGPDPTYARIDGGRWRSDAPYGTIHRIAGDGTVRGVLAAAVAWGWGQIPHLRIDTHADNRVMRHLVEKLGFRPCGTIYVRDGSPRIAYEKLPEDG